MKVTRKKPSFRAHISMINLIDIIFVLLIFFMITTTFKKYTNFDVKLPQSSLKLDEDNETLTEVIYLKNGNYVLKTDKKEDVLSLEELKIEIESLQNKKRVKLSAHKEIEYGKVVELMVELKKLLIENVELNIEKK